MINRIAAHLVSTILLFSFSALALQSQRSITREEYIQTYKDWAIEDMKKSGIPASIKIAQGILESADGNSSLAVNANNHFGIKCHRDWTGPSVLHDDDHRNECFRKYNTPIESFKDHTLFLTTRSRYQELFDLDPTDYVGWAHGLSKAGYATNPRYAELLIRIIEENRLYLLDAEGGDEAWLARKQMNERRKSGTLVINPFLTRQIEYNNGVRYIEVKEGDTYQSITGLFKMRDWEIARYNDIPENADISAHRYIYIEAKRNRAHPDHPIHVVAEGETMHMISQRYGVRMARIYHYNNMVAGSQPAVGKVLNLRRRAR